MSAFEPMLTSREAARLLDIDRRTLYRWAVPYHKVGPHGWRRYRLSDLRTWQARARFEAER
jgi:DNA invertase Pin-like site-specific DNA recombinase